MLRQAQGPRRRTADFVMPDGEHLPADIHAPWRGAGRAPLVMVHGTLVSRRDYRSFAPLLAAAWGGEVIVYDRRGRDRGHPQPEGFSLFSEADDLDAVARQCGAAGVVGHSYGGSVTLAAAGRRPGAFSWCTYDAALNPEGTLARLWRPEFRTEIDAGHLDAGWALLVNGLGTAGPVSRLPLSMLRHTGHALADVTPVGRRMYAALPGSLREMESILAQSEPFPLPERGLMLNGGLSPRYFHDATAFVAASHPGVRTRVWPWLMHNGPMLPLPLLAREIARWHVEHPARARGASVGADTLVG